MGPLLRAGYSSKDPQEKIIDLSFYKIPDVLAVAKSLIGKGLFTNIDGVITGGIITETEGYAGIHDRASHAYGNRRTKRTEAMYGRGGIAYIYLCYGIHHLFNIVTNIEGTPEAVLIRALYPTHGIETMLKRRSKKTTEKLTSGPGALTQSLKINQSHYGMPLNSPELWIADLGISVERIKATPRIGVAYAQEDALLPYRFISTLD